MLVLAVGLLPVMVAPAMAATAPTLSDFVLRPASNYQQLMDVTLDLDRQLPKLGVQNILEQASRQGTPRSGTGDTCNPDAVDIMQRNLQAVYSFCFDPADSGINGGNVEWTPQGVTTVADAVLDKAWGTAHPLVVSWYNDDSEKVKGTRVTFIDPSTGAYQHVLLVYPFTNDSGNSSYMSLRTEQTGDGSSLHAGGMVWYGKYLYVADTRRGFRVFSTDYIFDLLLAPSGNTADKTKIGRQDGVFYGHGYRYVMPEITAWTSVAGQQNDADCHATGSPKFSYVGLDRSDDNNRRLTSGEYCNGAATADLTGRVASWPMNREDGLPRLAGDGLWHATSAYRLPVSNVQGAVSNGNTWYLTRSHGEDVGGQNDNGDLLRSVLPAPSPSTAVLPGPPQRITAAIGPEDLSYYSDWRTYGDVLFTVTEHPGQRMVYATPVSAF